jgi:hypothetical protein
VSAWHRFLAAGAQFCRRLDDAGGLGAADFRRCLHQDLAGLYAAATSLSYVEPATPELLPEAPGVDLSDEVIGLLDEDFYRSVEPSLSTLGQDAELVGSLVDDLSEIAADISQALAARGRVPEADIQWQARFDFLMHWGQHAVDALRVTHRWLLDD